MNLGNMSFDHGILHLANWLGNVIMPTLAAAFISAGRHGLGSPAFSDNAAMRAVAPAGHNEGTSLREGTGYDEKC